MAFLGRNPGSLTVWNVAKTVAALEKAGHKQIIRPPTMRMPTDRSRGLHDPSRRRDVQLTAS